MQASTSTLSSCSRQALKHTTPRIKHFSRAHSKPARVTATMYDVAVKGDPVNKKLGDCPFSQRVLITLANKGLEYNQTPVDFAKKPDWLMQASGGKVPVLRQEEKGLVMPDSDVIVEYLEKEHPTPSMKSKAPAELGASFFPTFVSFLKAPAGSTEEAEARSKLEGELQAIGDYLSKEGPLMGGNSIDMKDAALAPKLYHAVVAAKAIKGYSIPDKFKPMQTYFDTLGKMPAWRQTLPTDGDSVIVQGWKAKVAA